jgi:hypothetical protein
VAEHQGRIFEGVWFPAPGRRVACRLKHCRANPCGCKASLERAGPRRPNERGKRG